MAAYCPSSETQATLRATSAPFTLRRSGQSAGAPPTTRFPSMAEPSITIAAGPRTAGRSTPGRSTSCAASSPESRSTPITEMRSDVPLTRAVSTLEAFQKERERSTDRLLEEPDAKARANLISLDRTYFARVVGERLAFAQQLLATAPQTSVERDALDKIGARLSAVSARIADEEKAAQVLTGQLAKVARAPAGEPSLADPIARLQTAERRVDHELKA